MENQTNSIAYNLSKLRKYQERLSASTDQKKNTIYNQKIRFYQQNLKGAGVNESTVGNPTGSQSTEVDSLISKIDNLIQKSKSTRANAGQFGGYQFGGRQSGGYKTSLSGHRIMTTGSRQQRGGVIGDAVKGADLLAAATALLGEDEIDPPADSYTYQDDAAAAVKEGIRTISQSSKAKTDLIQQLETRIIELRLQIADLERARDAGTAAGDDAQHRIAELEQEVLDITGERDELQRKLDAVKDEIAEVNRLIGTKNPSAQIQDPDGADGDMIPNPDRVAARDEADELHDELEAARGDLEKLITDRDRRIDDLEAALARALTEAAEATGATTEADERIDALTEEKERLEDVLRRLANAHEKLRTKATDLEGKAVASKGHLEDLAGMVGPLTHDTADAAGLADRDVGQIGDREYTTYAAALGADEGADRPDFTVSPVDTLNIPGAAVQGGPGAGAGDAGLEGGSRLDQYLQYSIQVPDSF